MYKVITHSLILFFGIYLGKYVFMTKEISVVRDIKKLTQVAEIKMNASQNSRNEQSCSGILPGGCVQDIPATKEEEPSEDEDEPIEEYKRVEQSVSNRAASVKKTSESQNDGLEKKPLKNLTLHLSQLKALTKITPMVERLVGNFEGQIAIEDGKFKGETHDISMNLSFYNQDDGLFGETDIILSREGAPYSKGHGSGDEQLKYLDSRSQSLFIQSGPGTFFEYMYNSEEDLISINYYSDFLFVGSTTLMRR